MLSLIMVVHVLLALILIGLVVIQRGKGSSIGAAFGSGTSGTIFGPRGATSFLQKLTYGIVFLFFITSITLSYLSTNKTKEQSNFEKIINSNTDKPNPQQPATVPNISDKPSNN
ncbi:MAG: preprotein translocase subunit SecG [Methylacidiphilales bacterium]|nr:preprotein translocase subunit SecG [Candidatus Methylacidiphilales bacterium]